MFHRNFFCFLFDFVEYKVISIPQLSFSFMFTVMLETYARKSPPKTEIYFILVTVDGGFSSWGPYGKCSKSCGGGQQTRERTCTNPPPANGGKDCSELGPSTSSRKCNQKSCGSKISLQYPLLYLDKTIVNLLRNWRNVPHRHLG